MLQFALNRTSKITTFETDKLWDLLIIGGGPAGLNAALYAKRKGLEVGVLAKEIGGQLHNTSTVDNYLGLQWMEGKDLSNAFLDHINTLEIPIRSDVLVTSIQNQNSNYLIHLSDGAELLAKSILITTGGAPRRLQVPGEIEFANKGVSYCTTCDAPFFKGKHVIVAGGGNSAAEAVLDLVPWADKITVVHRSQWRADPIVLAKHQEIPNLTVHLQTEIKKIVGDDLMRGIEVFDKITQESRFIEADGLFIEIGTNPNSGLVESLVKTNDQKEIVVDEFGRTSTPGIFAAGDVTNQPFKQIIIAAADGAKAALAIHQYLTHEYKGEYL